MATKADIERLNRRLTKMARDLHKSKEFKAFFGVPLTKKRAGFYIFERAHFVLNRRQCWAIAASLAPFDVKRQIWHHEEDELAGNRERGVPDHFTLGVMEGATVGLKPKDFERKPSIATQTCTKAWLGLAETSPRMKAVAASGCLEISNSDDVVGQGQSRKFGQRMEKDLGIAFEKQASNAEHVVAEIEHANLVLTMAKSHMNTKQDEELIIEGAAESWGINQVWFGLLADMMMAMPAPKAKVTTRRAA
ncbi:MAG: hypothetical protein AB7P12_18090 [Alphaproteobacteria bacterium]